MEDTRIVAPAFPYEFVRLEDGTKVRPPEGWELLPPGDAGLTRRVKAAGSSWTVRSKKGRRTFSHGVWAPRENIQAERARLETERATPEYAARKASGARRRERQQGFYVEEFQAAVVAFLQFAPVHLEFAERLASAVTAHATPVGSGTVARTRRISIERRAEAAVIAWMRHQTTAYEHIAIPRVKGARREMRATLAQESRKLLGRYRRGDTVRPECPLSRALEQDP
jgi:hypothetical protein